MEFLGHQIKDIASELILDALENGDALATARKLRSDIIAGWKSALEATGMPEKMMRKLTLEATHDTYTY